MTLAAAGAAEMENERKHLHSNLRTLNHQWSLNESCGLFLWFSGFPWEQHQVQTDPFLKCDVHRKNPDRGCGHTSLQD